VTYSLLKPSLDYSRAISEKASLHEVAVIRLQITFCILLAGFNPWHVLNKKRYGDGTNQTDTESNTAIQRQNSLKMSNGKGQRKPDGRKASLFAT
jgi:hypothetical protein